jgi:hypothetical protein
MDKILIMNFNVFLYNLSLKILLFDQENFKIKKNKLMKFMMMNLIVIRNLTEI